MAGCEKRSPSCCGCRWRGAGLYRNSADALRHLLSGDGVRRIDAKSAKMQNGVAHCVVQVTLANGEEYRIEDYGDDAEELCRAAKEHPALLCLH